MSLPVCCDYSKDLRSETVPTLMDKEKRARYRGIPHALLGAPTEDLRVKKDVINQQRKNKEWQTKAFCKKHRMMYSHETGKIRKVNTLDSDRELVLLPRDEVRGSRHYDDDMIPGVLYSYDSSSTPSSFTDAWGSLVEKAEAKYENKVFENLVKTEYELIDSTSEEESDEEFELV
jgi:hypothetical protein